MDKTIAMPRLETIRLEKWHRYLLYLASLGLMVTGIAWLWFHYFDRLEDEYGSMPHPLEYVVLQWHGVWAFLFIFLFGSLLNGHMRQAWALGRNRIAGSLLLTNLLILTVTACLLYYASHEMLRDYASVVHWLAGLLAGVCLPLHIMLGRK
ncbi:MAG: hypothetical protein H0W44_06685 [Gammaproteobacteria bacterium]|nr:hypothetical protein [Gammaproteobacteria bacterium]